MDTAGPPANHSFTDSFVSRSGHRVDRTPDARCFNLIVLASLFSLATGCVNVAGLWHPVDTDSGSDSADASVGSTQDGSDDSKSPTHGGDTSDGRSTDSGDPNPTPGDETSEDETSQETDTETSDGPSSTDTTPDDSSTPDDTSAAPPPLDPVSVTVRVERETQYQTLTGFGAAVAWYGELLLQHPHSEELFELAFRDLGLDILRLRNIYRGPDAPFDVLSPEIVTRANASLGRPIQIFMSSWSPPAALKANGTEECSSNRNCTLAQDEHGFVYDAFADWWLESLQAYAEIGIVPDYISIQNEPDYIPPSWEGCRFAPTENEEFPGYDRALEEVHERLLAYEPRPQLAGPEVIGLMYDKLANFTQTSANDLLDVVVHHLYDGQTWEAPHHYIPLLQEANQIAADRPLLQTEFSAPGKDAGFETAWLIHNVLVEGNGAGYLYWDLIWVGTEGLISIEAPGAPEDWESPRGYILRDEYYSVRHYAAFTDPGDRRVEARSSHASVKASAFVSPDQSRTTVVLLNTGQAPALIGIEDLHAHGSVAGYRSADGEFFEPLAALGRDAVIELPPRGIVTLVQR